MYNEASLRVGLPIPARSSELCQPIWYRRVNEVGRFSQGVKETQVPNAQYLSVLLIFD